MSVRILILLGFLALFMGACAPKDDKWVPPRPDTGEIDVPHTRRAVHKGHPKIDGQGVRDWFATVRFPGWRRLSIFSEFHPDEGSFVARYGKGPKVLYLSYIDNQRMSQFGLRRDARELLQTGRQGLPAKQEISGVTWYAVDAEQPLLAADVTKDVKLLLMGYQGLELADLEALAKALPVNELRERAGE